MFDLKKIKIVLDGPSGTELKKYLVFTLGKLRNINNIKDCSKAQDQAVEFKAQKKAYNKLYEILENLITIKETPEEEKTDPDNDYGV